MKKKTALLYFLVPIAALLAFIPFFWRFNANYEANEAVRAEAIHQSKIAAIAAQDKLRQQAIDESLVTSARRQKEKKDRDDRLQRERDEKDAAYQARNKAESESRNLKDRSEHLQKDVDSVKADIAKLDADEGKQRQEADAAKQYVTLAEANVKNLSQVLDRIAAADAAAEAAAKAAAAKKSSS
jgi:hypothetical protein